MPAMPPQPASAIDPNALGEHRTALLRYARLQLRNEAWAEDAVSETLLAALERPRSFDGRAQLRTWLVGILKHKVVDALRRHQREVCLAQDDDGEDLDELLFQADGHFRERPMDWGDPQARLGQLQFIHILEACVERLPAQTGRVFLMREWLELETDEICKELGLTPTNLWVILHRARLKLRECLQLNGFAPTAPR
jgi:RNA polymerase sigma-70 factor (TIGR02943 family)